MNSVVIMPSPPTMSTSRSHLPLPSTSPIVSTSQVTAKADFSGANRCSKREMKRVLVSGGNTDEHLNCSRPSTDGYPKVTSNPLISATATKSNSKIQIPSNHQQSLSRLSYPQLLEPIANPAVQRPISLTVTLPSTSTSPVDPSEMKGAPHPCRSSETDRSALLSVSDQDTSTTPSTSTSGGSVEEGRPKAVIRRVSTGKVKVKEIRAQTRRTSSVHIVKPIKAKKPRTKSDLYETVDNERAEFSKKVEKAGDKKAEPSRQLQPSIITELPTSSKSILKPNSPISQLGAPVQQIDRHLHLALDGEGYDYEEVFVESPPLLKAPDNSPVADEMGKGKGKGKEVMIKETERDTNKEMRRSITQISISPPSRSLLSTTRPASIITPPAQPRPLTATSHPSTSYNPVSQPFRTQFATIPRSNSTPNTSASSHIHLPPRTNSSPSPSGSQPSGSKSSSFLHSANPNWPLPITYNGRPEDFDLGKWYRSPPAPVRTQSIKDMNWGGIFSKDLLEGKDRPDQKKKKFDLSWEMVQVMRRTRTFEEKMVCLWEVVGFGDEWFGVEDKKGDGKSGGGVN